MVKGMSCITHSNTVKYESLVSAAARGVSASKWCRQTETPPAKAAKWQSEPQFTRDVQESRGKLLGQTVGKLTGAVNCGADAMIQVAGSARRTPRGSPPGGP